MSGSSVPHRRTSSRPAPRGRARQPCDTSVARDENEATRACARACGEDKKAQPLADTRPG